MKEERNFIQTISKHPFYIGIAAISSLVLAFLINFRAENIPVDISKWGQFGDYLGGMLNPIFGLMSVVIISVTLQLQIRSSKKQEFDNQFFSLLTLYDSVLQSIDRHSSRDGSVRKGRDCFYLFYKDIVRISEKAKVPLSVAYSSFLETRGWEIEHYFRTVYHLFKHVKDGQTSGLVAESEKKKYYDLIKSQISQHELILIWLNTQSQHKGKWDALIADSHADPFEHLNKILLNNTHLMKLGEIDPPATQPRPAGGRGSKST